MPVFDSSNVRPWAGRDADFAAAVARAEEAANPKPPPEHPHDHVARTRTGLVIRRNGDVFIPGPLLDVSSLPLLG